jgi:hypothetical protein
MPENVKQQAVVDCRRAVMELGLPTLRRHVGWFEPQYARDREVTGKDRGRYQRAFHRVLKRHVKQ